MHRSLGTISINQLINQSINQCGDDDYNVVKTGKTEILSWPCEFKREPFVRSCKIRNTACFEDINSIDYF